jgi:hypothetical protein
MTVPLPSRGQPIDLSYILTIVNSIDELNSKIASGKTESSIKYSGNTGTTSLLTSDLVFYSASQKINFNLSTKSGNSTSFSFNFKNTPIVLTSVESGPSSTSIPVYCVLNNISPTGCSVTAYSSKSTGTFDGNISIIAIGEAN